MKDFVNKKHLLLSQRRRDFYGLNSKNEEKEIVKAIYLVGTTRGFYAGHSAIVLVDKTGGGVLYSSQFDLKRLGDVAKGKWIPYELYRQELSAKDVKDYFKTGKIPNRSKNKNKAAAMYLSDYDKYISIPVKDSDLGRFMYEKAENMHKKPGMFNLYERNCNHLVQDILAAGGLNFTPTRGSCELVVGQIDNATEYIKKWKLLEALYYAIDEYRRDFKLGIIPNGAYDMGVEWAKKNGYKYGNIGRERVVIRKDTSFANLEKLNLTKPKNVSISRENVGLAI